MNQDWDKAVELELHGAGKYRIVKSTEEAAESLLYRWPGVKTGPAWIRAQKACLEALEGRMAGRHVRTAFIAAAAEAKISVRGK